MSRFWHAVLQGLLLSISGTSLGTSTVPEPYNHVTAIAAAIAAGVLAVLNHPSDNPKANGSK